MPEVILEGHGRPNVFLAGEVGQKYKDLDTNIEYVCRGERGFIRVDGDDQSEMYNWDMIESSGGGNELLLSIIDRSISGTLEIPEGITEIGYYAFSHCQQLKKVTIPEGVEIIKTGAFQSCWALSEVTLPHSLKNIYDNTFYDCTALEKINFPTGLQIIGDNVFYLCNNLKEVTLPDTITVICPTTFLESGVSTINVPWGRRGYRRSAMGCYQSNHQLQLFTTNRITNLNERRQ